MAFDLFFNSSLILLAIGMLFKIAQWFSYKIGIQAQNSTFTERLLSSLKAIFGIVFSPKIVVVLRVFILDVLFQHKILKQDVLRWIMHMLIFWGFILLFFMHALESVVSDAIFSSYYSTVNPYMFLRDFFGFMVLIGIAIAICRRFFMKIHRLSTNKMDVYAIFIVAAIILSGIFLEGAKIISYTDFRNMEEEFSALDYKEDILALEAYWVKYYGLVSPNITGQISQETLAAGEETHTESCADCHTRPQSAFTGYAVSKIMKPIGGLLDRMGLVTFLYYFHILACFIGLALLPFTKMLHIITTPISLITNAIMQRDKSNPLNIATRQLIELDACVHCNTCSKTCSQGPVCDVKNNMNILPSERMLSLRQYYKTKDLGSSQFMAIQEGIYLCSNCDRCTVVCPAGINLKELWYDVREEFIRSGTSITPLVLSPYSYNRTYNQEDFGATLSDMPVRHAKGIIASRYKKKSRAKDVLSLTDNDNEFKGKKEHTPQESTFLYCFSCENCTNVCPVVMNYEKPEQVLDLLPHQMMRSIGLGLKDLALGSNMLWDCVTCYQCQEHCPQNVKVTDIFYELKNKVSKDCFYSQKE
ncbi:4Fe-4S dicluster domain-containing protein [Desulfobacula sp.]|uniref:4Fe-4S dicluster domain-containing protein n=1 Tax=Desulfobacula sp. TaxID=2593537 RepID=UPI002635DBE5|nr:4Fe-4S dicluster domain-containing protein [Desulfobacula sp.]